MFGFMGYINPAALEPSPPELDEETAEALAEWFPQPPGFRTVMLCCAKCGHLSKMVIDPETTADEVEGWALTHQECLK